MCVRRFLVIVTSFCRVKVRYERKNVCKIDKTSTIDMYKQIETLNEPNDYILPGVFTLGQLTQYNLCWLYVTHHHQMRHKSHTKVLSKWQGVHFLFFSYLFLFFQNIPIFAPKFLFFPIFSLIWNQTYRHLQVCSYMSISATVDRIFSPYGGIDFTLIL